MKKGTIVIDILLLLIVIILAIVFLVKGYSNTIADISNYFSK